MSDEEEQGKEEEEEGFFASSADDGFPTRSSEAQRATEKLVAKTLSQVDPDLIENFKSLTREYVMNALVFGLESNFSSLDASRPWLCYWMCHSLTILGETLPPETIQRVIYTIEKCRHPQGGYGGGFMQMAHTAPTYASTMCLLTLGTREALSSIRRGPLYRFLLSLKHGNAFQVHQDGECDIRGMYTVLAVASICNMLTPELTSGCAEWIASAQGFDGGVGAEPGNESHGGYAYCALAGLVILGKQTLDLQSFSRWLYMRQMALEGGFQGRTNKLVDSCYSFWQGASFALLNRLEPEKFHPNCDAAKLLRYVVGACTHVNGGLRDKPGAHRDYYHTCYALSGLSVVLSNESSTDDSKMLSLKRSNPVYNVVEEKLGLARAFFARSACSHEELMNMAN